MLPDAIYYKREKIKIRWMGRKESQDLDCVGMFVPADNEILIYKNQSMKNVLLTFLHELYHLLCSKDNINVGKCGEDKASMKADANKAKEGKCGEGKCGEGTCGSM